MSEPVRTAEDVVEVSYAQFWITEDDDIPSLFGEYGNGLVELHPGAAAVRTGISTGPAALRVELHAGPPAVQTQQWDDVAEFTLWSLDGNLHIKALMDWPPPGIPVLAHARDRTVFEPTEHYLIQVWPADGDEHDPVAEHKLTDDVGAQNRAARPRDSR